MKNTMKQLTAAAAFLAATAFPGKATAQCTWSTYFYDSFEYTTVIPWIIPGTTYQNTPQTYAGCVHQGTYGLYLNFADGVSGLVYDQLFSNVCVGQNYRFSFWTKDTWGASNNMTFQVLDAGGNVLSTQNVINGAAWQNITMPAFVATTSDIHFQILTNMPGGGGNDAGLDELLLQSCNPTPPATVNVTQCAGGGSFDLYPSVNSLPASGSWTGPSALTNGSAGTFTPGSNANGLYTYTIDGIGSCPDSTAAVQVQVVNAPDITPPGPINACGSYTLPPITGTSLSGNQHYYTGPNGTGTVIANGSVLTTSQTIYIYDGVPGCDDNETVSITISQAGNAGNNNGASYCGPGPVVDMNAFLSAGTTPGGSWSETTGTPSGTFDPATGNWNTAPLTPGTYTFAYTVPANGACPSDAATFSVIIGNIPEVDLGNDTTLCTGQTMTLNAGVYDTYQWNNGSTNATKYVSSPGGLYWVKVGTLGANQIVNGNFESGNSGFTTQYIPGGGGAWGLLSNPGTYAITSSPNLVHNNFNNCTDHTPNPGTQQLVVNGASTPNTDVWCQTVPVQPNTTYQFGTWVTSVENGQPVAQLQFSINNTPLGSVFSPSMNGCNWSQFTQTWASGAMTSAEICIVNQNVAGGGNDFALDDITFRPICYSIDSIYVTYSAPPVVNLGPDQFHCEGTTVTLDAQNAGSSFLWNTGETTQTLDVTTTGTHSVTVTNPSGCSASDAVTVTFETQLAAGNDSLDFTCSTADQFDLATLLQSTAAAGGTWTSLSPGYGGTVSPAGIAGLTGQAGTFDFEYVVHGTYCPNDTALFTLTVHQQPVAAPDQSLHHCNTNGTSLDMTPYLNHPFAPLTGYWNEPANLPAGAFDQTTNVLDLSGLPNDNYVFDFVLPSEPGCVQDTTTITLKVTAVPVVQFTSDVTEGCQPLNVTFVNESIAPGNTVYSWNLGDGTTSASPTVLGNTYETAQCYDVTLTVTADGLCTSTQTIADMICVHAVPQASFYYGPQQVFSDGPTADFTNTSVNHDFSSWDFGDGGTSIQEHPTHTFPPGAIGNYLVELIVSTQFGCTDTAWQVVVVKDQLLYYVPNTFTPDEDEFNPVFKPVITAGIDEHAYVLEIYNRWGELVFRTTDVEEGWDGTYRGYIHEGVYTWKLQLGLLDDDSSVVDMGHVNLIR